MVFLITGHRNSGKSEFYEKLLEQKKNRLYVATLWKSFDTCFIIKRHQDRRSGNWAIYESTGHIEQDRLAICQLINGLREPKYCLIDGLTNWCLCCSRNDNLFIERTTQLALMIVDLVCAHPDMVWYLLDNVKSDFSSVPILEKIWIIMHNKLKDEIEGIHLVEWRMNDENNLG